MSKDLMKWLKRAGIIFAAVFVILQVYSSLINPVTTDTVYKHSAYSGYDASGYIIRNETVLKSSVTGTLGYEISDGGRVAKNGTVAVIYPDGESAERRVKIEKLDLQIEKLKAIQTYNDLNAIDIGALDVKIRGALSALADETQNGEVVLSENYDNFLSSVNRKQIVTGQIGNFNQLIASLEAERDNLKASVSEPMGEIKAPLSGYVIYTVDGYETAVSADDLESLSAEAIKEIKPTETATDAVCKIVSDYEWYIAAEVPFDEALKLKLGNKIKLKTKLLSTPELTVTIKHINKQSVNQNAVVVFACNNMNTELAATRNLDITIVYDEHEGLRVDNRAIRVVDGVRGVYVLTASQVKFVPVNIIWKGENYSIAELKASNEKVLRIYDEIIVKGKNLYDGKIID